MSENDLSAAEILARYRPSTDDISVEMPGGEVFTFSPITSKKAREDLNSKAFQFVELLPKKGDAGFKAHMLSDVIPDDRDDAFSLIKIHFRSISPKLSQRDALGLLSSPEVYDYLQSQLGLADKRLGNLFQQRILDEAKKNLKRTPSSESDSPHVPASSLDETTNS